MALGWKDVSVTRTNGGADIFRLAALLGNDNLIRHRGLGWWTGFENAFRERIVTRPPTASRPMAGLRQGGKTAEKNHQVARRTGPSLQPPQHQCESSCSAQPVLSLFEGQVAPDRDPAVVTC